MSIASPHSCRPQVEKLEDRTLLSVDVLFGTEGLDSFTAGGVPASTQIAASPTHVIEVAKSALTVFDWNTGERLYTQSLRDFFAPLNPGATFFDPLITYDEQAGRFVLGVQWGTFRGGPAREPDTLAFAVSNSTNPLDGFSDMHSLPVFGGGNARLGWNGDAYVFSMNGFCPEGIFCLILPFAPVVTIDKVSVLDRDPGTLTSYRSIFPFQGDVNLMPATMHGPSAGVAGGPLWFVGEDSRGGIRVLRMDNVLTDRPSFQTFNFEVAGYTAPPRVPQAGSTATIDPGDTRITSAAARFDWLVAGQTVGTTGPAGTARAAHARFYEFYIGTSEPLLFNTGEIDPGPGIHTFLPALTFAVNGDLGMTFVQSSASEPMSMYVTGRKFTSLVWDVQTPVLVRAGDAPYTGGTVGFYSGISPDPTGEYFWAANQYPRLPGIVPLPNWATWVSVFAVSDDLGAAPAGFTPSIPPGPVTLLGTVRTPIFAIGGETTGIIVITEVGTFELDIRDPKLRALVETLDGQRVALSGVYGLVPGIEIRLRHIIDVEALFVAEPLAYEITGVLDTRILAIGGQTTGVALFTEDGGFYELDLRDDPKLLALAELFDQQPVRVTGTLIFLAGVEFPIRYVILVDTLELLI